MNNNNVKTVYGRSCDGCTLCCKLLSIEEINKPRLKWCQFCDIGKGCKTYPDRPNSCKEFHCGYLISKDIEEFWKPENSKLILSYKPDVNTIIIFSDLGRLGAWRSEPFYSRIKAWAVEKVNNNGQVIVWQGKDVIVVLPDREENLGPIREDQLITIVKKQGQGTPVFAVEVIDKDDKLENFNK